MIFFKSGKFSPLTLFSFATILMQYDLVGDECVSYCISLCVLLYVGLCVFSVRVCACPGVCALMRVHECKVLTRASI